MSNETGELLRYIFLYEDKTSFSPYKLFSIAAESYDKAKQILYSEIPDEVRKDYNVYSISFAESKENSNWVFCLENLEDFKIIK